MLRFILYAVRWQLSTPILAGVAVVLSDYNPWLVACIANLIGSAIFFHIDKFIFLYQRKEPTWYVQDKTECCDCRNISRSYRLVQDIGYDRTRDPNPQWRCERCSIKKYKKFKGL